MMKSLIENLHFDENGLIPAIIQDEKSGKVLMMAYMNAEALEKPSPQVKPGFIVEKEKPYGIKGKPAAITNW